MKTSATSTFAPPIPLAPPGAGIPLPHRLFLRLFVKPFRANRSSYEQSAALFEKSVRRIRRELEGLSEAELTQPVLVKPLRGLEDSSRFWSIAMALEHMVIEGRQISIVIRALDADRAEWLEGRKADTATVKPTGERFAREALADFRKFAEQEAPGMWRGLNGPQSDALFLHPWFGKMNSRAWFWLLGAHNLIHLQQIREIKKGLKAKKPL